MQSFLRVLLTGTLADQLGSIHPCDSALICGTPRGYHICLFRHRSRRIRTLSYSLLSALISNQADRHEDEFNDVRVYLLQRDQDSRGG